MLLDSLFPEMHFKLQGDKYLSKYHLDGQKGSKGNVQSALSQTHPAARVCDFGTGESVSLIDLYMGLRNVDFITALREMCNVASVELPEMSERQREAYTDYNERQKQLEAAAAKFKKTLWYEDYTDGVRMYFRNVRGWGDELKETEIGVATYADAEQFLPKEMLPSRKSWGERSSVVRIAVPIRLGNRITGFKFRVIRKEFDGENKWLNTPKAETGSILFNINLKAEDVVIVESELDALHARALGISNVVASIGGAASVAQLKDAMRRGVKTFTLFYDNEESGRGDSFAQTTIARLAEAGIRGNIFVGEFPNGCKDLDDYLKDHKAPEEFNALRRAAKEAYIYEFCKLYNKRIAEFQAEPHAVERVRWGLIDDIAELVAKPYAPSYALDRIFEQLKKQGDNSALAITFAEYSARAQATAEQRQREKVSVDLRQELAKAQRALADGNNEEAARVMREAADKARAASGAGAFKDALQPNTMRQTIDALRQTPVGLRTGLYLDRLDRSEDGVHEDRVRDDNSEIILPAAALTIIGAPTSHGKTTFLQNLALHAAQDGNDGDVLFVTYEEPAEDVVSEFLTLFMNEELSRNTLRSIKSFYKTNSPQMFKGSCAHDKEACAAKVQEAAREFDKILASGKLRVMQRDTLVDDLIGLVLYLREHVTLKAVFVDYVQRLTKAGFSGTRKDELKTICNELMRLSTTTKLPVILGAQVNRECPSPVEMSNQELADASDIEHSANTILLLWNSSYLPHHKKSAAYGQGGKPAGKDGKAKELENRGLVLGQRGQLYVTLSKCRGGERGLDGIFFFNGNTRKIKSYPKNDVADDFSDIGDDDSPF